jgi:hypothetical protein
VYSDTKRKMSDVSMVWRGAAWLRWPDTAWRFVKCWSNQGYPPRPRMPLMSSYPRLRRLPRRLRCRPLTFLLPNRKWFSALPPLWRRSVKGPATGSSPAYGECWRDGRTHHTGVRTPRRTTSSAPACPVKSTAYERGGRTSARLCSQPRSRCPARPRVAGPLPIRYWSNPLAPQRCTRNHRRRRAVGRARLRPSQPYSNRCLPAWVLPFSCFVGAPNRLPTTALRRQHSDHRLRPPRSRRLERRSYGHLSDRSARC